MHHAFSSLQTGPKWRKTKIGDKVSQAWPGGEKWLGGVAVDFVLIPPINPLASCNTNVNGSVESKQSQLAPQTPPHHHHFFSPG